MRKPRDDISSVLALETRTLYLVMTIKMSCRQRAMEILENDHQRPSLRLSSHNNVIFTPCIFIATSL